MSFIPTGAGNLEETKRVARLLDIIARINSRPRYWTRRALAEAFEISERRIQQDFEILNHRLNLPIQHSRTGYYFTNPQAFPPVAFNTGEAIALLLAAQVGQHMAGVDTADLIAALTRLTEAFPKEFRSLATAVTAQRAPNPENRHRNEVLQVVNRAIANGTTLRMVYSTASRDNAQTERDFDPYAIIPFVRSFHIVGFCHYRQKVLVFKVDRIASIVPTQLTFSIPEDFDVSEYLGSSWGLIRGNNDEVEKVRIHFTPRAGRWVSEERWHPSQNCLWQPDASLILELELSITPNFVRWVLNYGADAHVLAPPTLARLVAEEAQALIEQYRSEGHLSNEKASQNIPCKLKDECDDEL